MTFRTFATGTSAFGDDDIEPSLRVLEHHIETRARFAQASFFVRNRWVQLGGCAFPHALRGIVRGAPLVPLAVSYGGFSTGHSARALSCAEFTKFALPLTEPPSASANATGDEGSRSAGKIRNSVRSSSVRGL